MGHHLEALAISAAYRYPAKGMRVIGVTGTNGKTSTTYMIHKMLTANGKKSAMLSTVAYGIGDDLQPQAAHMTTLPAAQLNRQLRAFAQQGVEFLVLETSSHALAQHRTAGVPFEIAVITNITHDHLDYHKTFEAYQEAKKRLFLLAAQHPRGYAVVNQDDAASRDFRACVKEGVSYGLAAGELTAHAIRMTARGMEFTAAYQGEKQKTYVRIAGEFYVSNALASIAVGLRVGLSLAEACKGVEALAAVPGRMQMIDGGQVFRAIVDFAHTPDSFERVLSSLRNTTKGKLCVVFGSASERDEAKRPVMGEIAAAYADVIVLTEEDARKESVQKICDEIMVGIKRQKTPRVTETQVVLDRSEAIAAAVEKMKTAEDVVIFLGKGHETTIERLDGEHPWDEVAEVRRALLSSKNSS